MVTETVCSSKNIHIFIKRAHVAPCGPPVPFAFLNLLPFSACAALHSFYFILRYLASATNPAVCSLRDSKDRREGLMKTFVLAFVPAHRAHHPPTWARPAECINPPCLRGPAQAGGRAGKCSLQHTQPVRCCCREGQRCDVITRVSLPPPAFHTCTATSLFTQHCQPSRFVFIFRHLEVKKYSNFWISSGLFFRRQRPFE